MNEDVLKPKATLLIKLGSIAVHVEELLSYADVQVKDVNKINALNADMGALKSVLEDSEVKTWIEEMDELALVPKKR